MAGLIMALALAAAPAAGPTPPDKVHQYHDVVISPAGDLIAGIESDDPLQSEADPHPVVVVRSRADGKVLATYDPCPTCFYAGAAWSPDGKALAFVSSNRKTRTATLEVVRDGKAAVALDFAGLLDTPRWSPDGQTLAVLATDRPRKQTGATQAGAALVGEIGAATDEQRIAILPSAGGPLKFLSPADTFVYEYDWTPDGKAFVATAAKGDGDNNWWIAKLAAVGVDGSFRVIADPGVQMKWPKASPDGRSVSFIGGLHSDFGPTGGDIWTVPLAGGRATDKTPGFKGSFTSLAWRQGTLFATAIVGDNNAVLTVDPASGATKTLFTAPATFSAGEGKVSLSADGKILAGVSEDFTTAPHIGAGPVGSPHQITHENDAVTPQVTARSITWKNEGFEVQGWLTGPAHVEPGKKYPMIVLVHGGPSSAVQPTYMWKGTTNDLVQHGFFVFQANPRGSFGQGEAFTKANIKDFGGGDLRDILAGVDAVEKVAPVDDKRLGVYGHSYGGFMTMWTVTHSQRFKAGVAGAGIADWVSYYGENGIDKWMVPFFGATAYDDPATYDRMSPIRYIHAAKTPTFIYVGERDVECPPDQSLQFHHGLDSMGVPNSLVIYAGEGHGIREAEHREDLKRRTLAWFDKYLGQP
ncbi:S9 family peptidase [Phenylobacterium sp.]|uniref:S9 family peptidase n=1 Tax=Phenylobacterium sp. TaxID=1871053 RepID=UPI001212D38A|nr:S9 family peptidase [Phenylobacterium sp.]THD63664.1 MAG: S9 family peptidase [Phenylobacterium sp.]